MYFNDRVQASLSLCVCLRVTVELWWCGDSEQTQRMKSSSSIHSNQRDRHTKTKRLNKDSEIVKTCIMSGTDTAVSLSRFSGLASAWCYHMKNLTEVLNQWQLQGCCSITPHVFSGSLPWAKQITFLDWVKKSTHTFEAVKEKGRLLFTEW